jgi:hypothetical protein
VVTASVRSTYQARLKFAWANACALGFGPWTFGLWGLLERGLKRAVRDGY